LTRALERSRRAEFISMTMLADLRLIVD